MATVNGSGVVTGVAVGSATATATSESKSGTAAVTVTSTSSGPPFGPGESGILFTAIDPASLLRQNLDLWQSFGRVGKDEEALAWADVFGIQLGLVVPEIKVAAPSTPLVFPNFTPGSLITARETTAAGASRSAAITTSVLFAGGYEDATSINSTPRAVLYDPLTNQATELHMTAARLYFTITPLSGSRALLAGGFDGDDVLSSAEIFTESTKSFAATGSMGSARGRHAAAVLPDGRVLITGGLIPVGGGPVTIDAKTTEIFDPAAATFTPGPDMGVARFNHSAIALDDGRVLVLGGNHLSSAEVFDPVGGTFAPAGSMNAVHGLGHKAVKLLDGKVLVLGGDEGTIQPSAVAELFDPATNQFTQIDDMTTTRMLHFAAVNESDGKVLIGGGQDASGEILASTEVYDPVTETFTPFTDMPAEDSEQAAVFVQQ